jgi:hypothetical protein
VPASQKKGRRTKESGLFDSWLLDSVSTATSSLTTGELCVGVEAPAAVVMKSSVLWDATPVDFGTELFIQSCSGTDVPRQTC